MIYVFGNCELDQQLYELCHAGAPVKLEPKAFKVLAYLIQHRDRVVTKDELFAKPWSGEFVPESALTRCFVKARQAVHDGGVAQRSGVEEYIAVQMYEQRIDGFHLYEGSHRNWHDDLLYPHRDGCTPGNSPGS